MRVSVSHRTSVRSLMNSTAIVPVALLLLGALNSVSAQTTPGALPSGGVVVSGQASISQPATNQLSINQTSNNAVTNWQSFSIGAGNRVDVAQPSTSSAMLARVNGSTTSTIAGQLSATGQLILVNPNGIAITPTGTVNAGAGFVASTLGISDQDFASGKRTFRGNGASASVSNSGSIRVGSGGYAALVGGSVESAGTISVPLGKVGLGSGERATLDFSGDGFLQVAVPTQTGGDKPLVDVSGTIDAAGGRVEIRAASAREAARQAINMTGVVEARTVTGTHGNITLDGGSGGVQITGKLTASSDHAKGGAVTVTGRSIKATGAKIDVSGKTGGGTVKIGGDWQGKGPLARAETTKFDAASTISANATGMGNGGEVVVWSDLHTTFAGTISALGGPQGGNGGEAEVSSHGVLGYTGMTVLTAPRGRTGTLLLDPYNVTISNATGISGFTANANDSVINVATLQSALASANVTITTGGFGSPGTQAGDITVAAPVTWGANTLTLQAYRSININANLTANGTAGLALRTNNGGTGGDYRFGTGVSATFTGTGQSLTINGLSYTLLYSIAEVDAIDGLDATSSDPVSGPPAGLSGRYALARNLNASGFFDPNFDTGPLIGPDDTNRFVGTFTGLGHTIENLILKKDNNYVGLFGYVGQPGLVRDLGLKNASITGGAGYPYTGGLIGYLDRGTLKYSYTEGTVSGINAVGGLIGGSENATVTESYSTATVSGASTIGGLIGNSVQTAVSLSYATGSVTGSGNDIGGLIGYSDLNSSISQSNASGAVTGSATSDNVGGLIGTSDGTVSTSYATGIVSGGNSVGGLIGQSQKIVSNSYATGDVTGHQHVGGLIGLALRGVTNSYATGKVEGSQIVGGLIGSSRGVGNVYSQLSATGVVSGTTRIGGLFGEAADGAITNSFATGVVTGNDDSGGFIGYNMSGNTINQSYATGSVNGSGASRTNLGGFAGVNDGDILNSHSSGAVTGFNYLGGFVGLLNQGSISDSYSTGSVNGKENLGGFVGFVSGSTTITNAYATGDVNGTNILGGFSGYINNSGSINSVYATGNVAATYSGINTAGNIGGLVGGNEGTVSRSYSTGSVTGHDNVGGLVGNLLNGGTIDLSYSTSVVSGDTYVAGLAGTSDPGTSISNSYAGGAVRGNLIVGGLVGYANNATISQTYAYGAVSGSSSTGGLIGLNNSSTVNSSYFDIETTGQTVSDGGTGLSTANLQNTLPAGFDASTWGTGTNFYPYLKTWFPTGIQVIAGTARTESGTVLASGSNGAVIINTRAGLGTTLPVSTGANGKFYGFFANGAIDTTNGSTILAYMKADAATGATEAATFETKATSSVFDFDIKGNWLIQNVDSGRGNISQLNSLYTAAIAGTPVSAMTMNNRRVTSRASSFTLDESDTRIGMIDVYVPGNLTITSGTTITGGDVSLAATGAFINNAGANAVQATTGRWLVYSASPGIDNFGGLNSNNDAVWNTAARAAVSATGNRYVFASTAKLTLTTTNDTKTYGDNATSLVTDNYFIVGDAGVAGAFTSGVSAGSYTGSPTITTAGAVGTASAGTYSYTVDLGTLSSTNGYDFQISNVGVYTVTPRAITVTANALTREYGSANPALTYTVSGLGLVNGDTLTGGLTTSATTTSAVGNYVINQGTLAASSNYALTYQSNTLTVTPRAITVTADALSRLYGNANPALTYTVSGSGLVNGDTLTGGLTTPATTTSAVGSYLINQGTLAASGNYALTYQSNNLTVTPRAITVTADALTREYGSANPALTYTVSGSGLVNGDTLSGALTTAANTTSNVGNYDINRGTLAATSNYAVTFQTGTLTVAARAITVTGDALSRPFGSANPALTYTISGSGLVNGDVLSGALSTTATVSSNVGSYAIERGTLAATSNYALTYQNGSLTVTSLALSVVVNANALSREYGNANPALTYTISGTGLLNGDQLTGALATTATTTSPVGTYTITQGTLAAPINYTLVYNQANLTVTPRAITVAANDVSRLYGAANPALTYTVSGSGLASGDTLADALTGAITTTATATSGVGNYNIERGTLAATSNYSLTYQTGTLTVTPRGLIVSGNSVSREYGDANPALTYAVSGSGLASGDTLADALTGAVSTTATTTSNVGNYDIDRGTLVARNNYALTYQTGTLSVTQRNLVVAANAISREYGQNNPALTYTVSGSGLINGNTLTGALATAANTISNVGNYIIGQGTLAAPSANYALTYQSANLTVTPRAIIVSADAISRAFGAENPPLTYRVIGQGLINGDQLSGALATTARATSLPGSYAITQGTLGSVNYSINYQPNTLVVTNNKGSDGPVRILTTASRIQDSTWIISPDYAPLTTREASFYANSSKLSSDFYEKNKSSPTICFNGGRFCLVDTSDYRQ
jgi:filamentous hemagglutinin family protein